jgi:hypothetical protein
VAVTPLRWCTAPPWFLTQTPASRPQVPDIQRTEKDGSTMVAGLNVKVNAAFAAASQLPMNSAGVVPTLHVQTGPTQTVNVILPHYGADYTVIVNENWALGAKVTEIQDHIFASMCDGI